MGRGAEMSMYMSTRGGGTLMLGRGVRRVESAVTQIIAGNLSGRGRKEEKSRLFGARDRGIYVLESSQNDDGKRRKLAFPDPEIEAFSSWEALRKRTEIGEIQTFWSPGSRHFCAGKLSER